MYESARAETCESRTNKTAMPKKEQHAQLKAAAASRTTWKSADWKVYSLLFITLSVHLLIVSLYFYPNRKKKKRMKYAIFIIDHNSGWIYCNAEFKSVWSFGPRLIYLTGSSVAYSPITIGISTAWKSFQRISFSSLYYAAASGDPDQRRLSWYGAGCTAHSV